MNKDGNICRKELLSLGQHRRTLGQKTSEWNQQKVHRKLTPKLLLLLLLLLNLGPSPIRRTE